MRWVAPVLAMLAALGGACTQTGPDVKGPAAAGTAKVVPAAKGPGSEWVSARFVEVRSLGQGVSMLLPEDAGWAIADPTNGWFVAQHAGTSTQIVVRWIATDGLANRARCEKRGILPAAGARRGDDRGEAAGRSPERVRHGDGGGDRGFGAGAADHGVRDGDRGVGEAVLRVCADDERAGGGAEEAVGIGSRCSWSDRSSS
ncbi:MAG: hypothetical protein R3F14_05160 [Polyangiaceae bacterium]